MQSTLALVLFVLGFIVSEALVTNSGLLTNCSTAFNPIENVVVGAWLNGTVQGQLIASTSSPSLAFIGNPLSVFLPPTFSTSPLNIASVLFQFQPTSVGLYLFQATFYDPANLATDIPSVCSFVVNATSATIPAPETTLTPVSTCNFESFLLKTLDPPVLNKAKSYISGGVLFLSVNVSAKYINYDISFSRSVSSSCNMLAISSLSNVSLPWSVERIGCYDIFSFKANYSYLASTCGGLFLQPSYASNQIVMGGELVVTLIEQLPILLPYNIQVNRTIISLLPFSLVFPSLVNISTNVNTTRFAFGGPSLAAAITYQKVVTSFGEINIFPTYGYLELTTVLPCPFQLKSSTATISSETSLIGATIQNSVNETSCVSQNVNCSVCTQVWKIYLSPDATLCSINGIYSINFTLVCQNGAPGSAFCASFLSTLPSNVLSVNLDVTSSSYCANLIDTIDLTAVMYTYSDPARLVAPSPLDFPPGSTIYGWIESFSSKALIARTVLTELTAIPSSFGAVSLLAGNADTPAGLVASFSKSDSLNSPRVTLFQFNVDFGNFPAVYTPYSLLILASINVTFAGNPMGLDHNLYNKEPSSRNFKFMAQNPSILLSNSKGQNSFIQASSVALVLPRIISAVSDAVALLPCIMLLMTIMIGFVLH